MTHGNDSNLASCTRGRLSLLASAEAIFTRATIEAEDAGLSGLWSRLSAPTEEEVTRPGGRRGTGRAMV